jgi:hypothetical protein
MNSWPRPARLAKIRPMSTMTDRRQNRSADPLVALHYHLASARARDNLDAMVLADGSGIVVAGAGSWAMCEEIAAYAPLLAGSRSARIEAIRDAVMVQPLAYSSGPVFLCARGGASEESLKSTAEGVVRILRAA